MKRFLSFFLICIMLLFSACGNKQGDDSVISVSIPMYKIALSEQGVVSVENNMLWFTDFEQKNKVMLSNNPECESQPYLDKERMEPACNAVISKQFLTEAVALHNKMVYLFLNETFDKVTVYKQNPASDGRQKIAEIPGEFIYSLVPIWFRGDYSFLVMAEQENGQDEFGNYIQKGQQLSIWKLDLKSGETSQLWKSDYKKYAEIPIFQLVDNTLMFDFGYFDDQMDFQDKLKISNMWDYHHSTLYSIDLAEETTTELIDTSSNKNRGVIGFNKDYYYMLDRTHNAILEYDLQKNIELSTVQQQTQLYSQVFNDFVLFRTQDNTEEEFPLYEYFKYDFTLNEKSSYTPPFGMTLPAYSYYDWFIIGLNVDEEYKEVVIKHQDYYNGKEEYIIIK